MIDSKVDTMNGFQQLDNCMFHWILYKGYFFLHSVVSMDLSGLIFECNTLSFRTHAISLLSSGNEEEQIYIQKVKVN